MREQARESLLFLPGVMLIVSVLIEIVLGELDQRHADDQLPIDFTFSPDVAVTLLGTIAGAMITTAGVVFSLMVVSLQLASGQFSPRVLRSFWRDRYGQVLVGMRPLLIAELPAQAVRDPHGRILLTPWDLDHVEYIRHAFSQLRVYAAPHAHVLMALVRTLRMLRAAGTINARAVAELDHQLALTLQGCAEAGLLPADRAAVEAAAG